MLGSRLRQYSISAKLGEGGMGVVWKARDTVLERDVALKVLPSHVALDETRRERFFREARAASALNHPNIVTVYEVNSENGVDFIAMELVEGETLAARLGRGPMPIDEALGLARQIADAVARAHRAGIVHRDLKPGNVMITSDSLIKVLDFGLAKVEERAAASDRTSDATRLALTRAGVPIGTAGYMSPEQALGDPTDARSDVFSFGVVLYQMLAGRLPFEGATNTEWFRALHLEEPAPLETVRDDVPPATLALIRKALAKTPRDRFPSMIDVAAALKQPVPAAGLTNTAGSLLTDAPRRRPAERHRFGPWSFVPIIGMAIGIGFSIVVLVPWNRILPDSDDDVPSTRAATRSASDLTLEATALVDRYDRPENLDRAVELLQKAIAADPDYATAYAQLGAAYIAKNRSTPDAQWITLARANVDRAIELNADLAVAHVVLGTLHQSASRLGEARAAIERALELDPLNARALVVLARLHEAANQEEAARAVFTRALAADPDDWRTHIDVGTFEYRRANFGDAVVTLETAKRLSPDNVVVLVNLGAAYYMAGRADEGASALQQALAIRPTGPVYTNLANIRFFQGRYADAAAAFEKAVELNANNPLVWGNLGDSYRWAPGRKHEAPDAYKQAIQLLDQQIASKPGDVNLKTRRASYLAKMGDPQAAIAELTRMPDSQVLTPQMLVRVATVHELAGDRSKALEAIGRALKDGYPARELAVDPEFLALRADARYHRIVSTLPPNP